MEEQDFRNKVLAIQQACLVNSRCSRGRNPSLLQRSTAVFVFLHLAFIPMHHMRGLCMMQESWKRHKLSNVSETSCRAGVASRRDADAQVCAAPKIHLVPSRPLPARVVRLISVVVRWCFLRAVVVSVSALFNEWTPWNWGWCRGFSVWLELLQNLLLLKSLLPCRQQRRLKHKNQWTSDSKVGKITSKHF